MSHLDEGLLHALLDGEIGSAELPPIQEHLATCAECRARLEEERRWFADAEELVGVLELPAERGETAVRHARPPRVSWRGLAWAASLLAAIGLGYEARGVRPPVPSRQAAAPVQPHAEAVFLPPRARMDTGAATPSRENAKPIVRKAESKLPADRPKKALVSETTRPGTTPGAPVAPAAPGLAARASERGLGLQRDQAKRLEELVVTGGIDAASRSLALLAPPEPITLPDAVRRLGGSLRLVEGLVPLRLEAQGQTVRVVYSVAQGELVLAQQLIDGRVSLQLIAPPGFPPDSLARLRARVRE